MNQVRIPWAAWYGDGSITIDFPDSWQVGVCNMKGGTDIGDDGIREALARPFGAAPLRESASGRRSAAILVDDLSRPTPAFRLLPYVLEELEAAGIGEDQVKIIAALAAHRPMTRQDFIKKVGLDIVDRMQVLNHNAYENLEFLGYSSRGIPIFVNRDMMSCEVKIALGMITPRGAMFGGGAKLLIPGACGQQTIMLNHRYIHENFREHLAEVARKAGLDYIVNPLLNPALEIIGLVSGEPEEAFKKGCELGRDLYATPIPDEIDIGVFNAFPKDTELCQAPLALVPLTSTVKNPLRESSTIVICSASPEGLGWHSVLGPGTALGGQPGRQKHRTILFSPGVNRWDCVAKFGKDTAHCRTWAEVVSLLQEFHGEKARVAVFPAGALQLAAE
ncbi:MAG: lactate racemase domain-containing protein [Planctomycetota bacterium]|jgi:nickel-dependent lactate racemase|nr:lactate racemase domain-containing protein [Planctomycetota bacterium]